MTLEQYVTGVLTGHIVIEPPIARVVLDIPDEDKMEPVNALRCHTDHPDGWVCTRTKEHNGRHIAQNSEHEICAIW
jgi:hypothetical protein